MERAALTSRAPRVRLFRSICAIALVSACGGEEFALFDHTTDGAGASAEGGSNAAGGSGAFAGARDNRGGAGSSATDGGLAAISGSSGDPITQGGARQNGGAGGRVGMGGDPVGSSGASQGGADAAGADGGADVGGHATAGDGGADDPGGADAGGSPSMAGSSGAAGFAGTQAGGAAAGTGGSKGCNSSEWFPDNDSDGYGRSSGVELSCMKPNSGRWTVMGGDCNDDNDQVLPDANQAEFSGSPYTTPDGEESFDYDCSGNEESDPSQFGAAPACDGLTLLACADKAPGFVATGRSGPGINPLCGSGQIARCVANGVTCTTRLESVSEKHRCR